MTPARKLALLFSACAVASAGLVAREGWVLKTYPDPVHGRAVPTGCAGVTEDMKMGQTFTEEECVQRTMLAMVKHAAPLLPCIEREMPPAFLGEMVSMSHNIGVGSATAKPPSGFLGSTMCREMKAGNYRAACDGILLWYKSGGIDCRDPNQRKCRGLWIDRQTQHGRCIEALR